MLSLFFPPLWRWGDSFSYRKSSNTKYLSKWVLINAYLVNIIWNVSYPATKDASLVKLCFPEPPTPTKRAFPRGVRITREICVRWQIFIATVCKSFTFKNPTCYYSNQVILVMQNKWKWWSFIKGFCITINIFKGYLHSAIFSVNLIPPLWTFYYQ